MKITKIGHSCVYVSTPDRDALFDPGCWSDKSLIYSIKNIDRIVYTHEHKDHFDIDILKKLVQMFPAAHVICNKQIESIIRRTITDVIIRDESACTRSFESPHENLPIPGSVAPIQRGYHFKDMFTHPGDSQHFSETKKVLAMPFIGPWGKTADSINISLQLKPEYILPIHDWHYSDDAKEWLQGILETSFAGSSIKLLSYKNGQEIDIA